MLRLPAALLLLSITAAAGCAGDQERDPFTASGEIIAFSGGDGGPAQACFTCHGLSGEGDGQASPRLAGLPSGYLQRQLSDYADGRRAHPAMSRIARSLSFADRQAVSDYYAGLAAVWTPTTASDAKGAALYHRGDPDRGLAPCAACHGARGEGLGPANPPLAGQPATYLAEQMRLWRTAKRRNDPLGVMLAVSQRLSDDEAAAVAQYAAALPSPAVPRSAGPEASRAARRPDR